MSFFEKKYLVTGSRGENYYLTAKELHERILNDSKSDYNWIASAKVLVDICKQADFPKEYALDIKCAILNCFANIEHAANGGGDRYYDRTEDMEAVQECYNSMYGIDSEHVVQARMRYLTEMIYRSVDIRVLSPHYHPGPTYRKLREDWVKSQILKFSSKKDINFNRLMELSYKGFIISVEIAEETGDFEEDERADNESWKNFLEKFNEGIK